jgi:DAACS family dicarboxylate/amino acid:cation (Na+ or H+) symporter
MTAPGTSPSTSGEAEQGRSLWQRWHALPLYLRILVGVILGLIAGVALRGKPEVAAAFGIPSKLVLQLLAALASPLIFLAVVQTLIHAEIPGKDGRRLVGLLILNTTVAILIGLLVANIIRPGKWTKAESPTAEATETKGNAKAAEEGKAAAKKAAPEAKPAGEAKSEPSPFMQFLDNIPKSLLGPFTDGGKVIGVIIVALAFGIALRGMHGQKGMQAVIDVIDVLYRALIVMLHWIIEIVPLAIFCVVTNIIGTKGFGQFVALGGFIVAVILALLLQCVYYLVRIRMGSWVRPRDVLTGMRDALMMAFSTASSTATMPLTYSSLTTKIGLRERSASMGALVGANFNNDGTALYEAMSALFVAQLVGIELPLEAQLMVVLTSIVASVGAAGIPEAGLVTMTLVFDAVGLSEHKGYIGLLLAVDWFLDRCRTAINVMGDVNVSCLLDGHERETPAPAVQPVPAEAEATS